MSFSFFKPFKAKISPPELASALNESLLGLDSTTVADGKAHEKALEEIDKNFIATKQLLCGDGELEPNQEQIIQFAQEICKEDVISLLIHKLPMLGWDGRKDLTHWWGILLRQVAGSRYCCVDYLESHPELLDFLVSSYTNKDIALSCGNMLRECIKYPVLAKYMLESSSFDMFFKYVELPNFDISSDALSTFKDLLTRNPDEVSEFLNSHYDQFFNLYEGLLISNNYVTRRQSLKLLLEFLLETPNTQVMKRFIREPRFLRVVIRLLKDTSKNIQISAFHIFKVFVANPFRPPEIVEILSRNHEELLTVLNSLPSDKSRVCLSVSGGEDEQQFEEERELVIKEITTL